MQYLHVMALALLTMALLAGCKKDIPSLEIKNEFIYNGTAYALTNGYLEYFGSNGNGTFDFDVILTSASVILDGGSLMGAGDVVYLDLNTSSAAGLVPGTYTWSGTREDFSIVHVSVGLDFDLSTLAGTRFIATAGTVDVVLDGNVTTVTFDLALSNGKTVTGEFEGVLQEI
jgi:hypothetical protein